MNTNKPLFACVIKEATIESLIKTLGKPAIEITYARELKDFRSLVLSKIVRFWEDAKDIKIAVSETLSSFTRRDDLIGWVRASQEANMPALADEIARLSKENAQLRSQIENKSEENIQGLSFLQLKSLLQDKGLLEQFYILRTFFISNAMLDYSNFIMDGEFILLGLIDTYTDTNPIGVSKIYYRLTDAGRIFLNKLEAERLSK